VDYDPWSGATNGTGDLSTFSGPQFDGTWNYPVSAIPVNNPANTAGYSAQTPAWISDVLKQGIGVLGSYVNTQAALDYRKFEATNGGLYRQGYPAGYALNGTAQMNPVLFWALILGGVYFLTKKA